jgi:hypothetical protein
MKSWSSGKERIDLEQQVEFGKKVYHISDLIPRALDRASPSERKDLGTNPWRDKSWPVGISDLLHLTFACHEG